MRPRTPERIWCDEHDLTMEQARRLGGYLRLTELQKNRPEIYSLVVEDMKRMAAAHRKEAA
jgi:hypothetical protein